ncbi:taste receptor type 2 member 7-like [Paroedura picta]|uniref:taste receptor type 2 member 7-like n=1 Tax=Paroedura picta TaxID=143630 RepID=UPI0040566EA6
MQVAETVSLAAEETLLFVLRKMATLSLIAGFVLLVMETLVGTVANGFIVLVCCTDWFRSRKLSRIDLILVCLASSRLLWQAVVILHVTMLSFFLHTYILEKGSSVVTIMWFFTDNVNLWLAACLSVWYLIKIAMFSHPIFLQVKQRFSRLVPWLLLGTVVSSVVMVLIVFAHGSPPCDPYKAFLNNSRDSEVKKICSFTDFAFSGIVPNVLPSVVCLSSTILLIISLWKHTRHLQHDGIAVRDLNSSAHLRAIQALASFALLYLFSFVARILQLMLSWESNDLSWTSVYFYNVSGLYPAGHAVVLILINPKLRQAWLRTTHLFKCREAPS